MFYFLIKILKLRSFYLLTIMSSIYNIYYSGNIKDVKTFDILNIGDQQYWYGIKDKFFVNY